ncbi:HDOD domain-containing protein [Gilvimarinus agarilyticus]|uniref:HDOD domain-containing protein n=1 Tax=Gilvimarinus agarilyticus TaxID=679259 RepID=UPI0005A2E22A|nr:HDOD domain-containing protein [Gilvimarinus agarilyticus]
MHVLIVEDDLAMQELLATLLRGLDSRVYIHIAETVEAGLSLWQKNPIDLLLCDWNLPNQQTGSALVKAIRAKDTDLPIVMITGRGDRATVTDSARYKVNEFIVKPFAPDIVMERLKPYFAGHNAPINIDDAPDVPPLDAFVGDVEQVLKRLTIMPGTEAALCTITQADQPSASELAQQWQRDPAITARLIGLANSSLMTRAGRAIATLREAISAVGVDMALTQVLALSLAGESRLQHAPLQTLAQQFARESQQLAEYAALLAKQLKLNVANCYTAGLMVRLGDCAVLDAVQLYIDSGGQASDDEIASALKKYAAEYGNRLKIKWRVPLTLRERIGATYSTTSGQVNPELLLMRLAACIAMEGDHTLEQEKLCRQLRLTPNDLPHSHTSEPQQEP